MSESAPQAVPQTVPRPRLVRSRQERLVAGVAGGLAAHLRFSPVLVRLGFVVLLPLNGLGALLYAVFWAVLPRDPAPPRRRKLFRLLPYAALALVLMVLVAGISDNDEDFGFSSIVGWLVALIAVGAGVMWHQSQSSTNSWLPKIAWSAPGVYLRFVAGGFLVVVGGIGLLAGYNPGNVNVSWSDLGKAVAFALVAVAGVGLVAAPLLWRMLTALRTEREGRIREQERAELAAMIHDQVLHTMALIQRNAADPHAVQRLARGQERSLRNWLYQPTGSPTEHFAAALEAAAIEVEDTYGIAVETVVVGDRQVDDKVNAIVAAAREAMVNAARHAQVNTISLYAEAEPGELSVFIRDRGVGFDVTTVEETRHGVRGSIIGRMTRHGGRAEIRSAVGEGTEIRLTVPVTRNREDVSP